MFFKIYSKVSLKMQYTAIAIVIAILIIFHHIYKHDDYTFPNRAFQISDIDNHETWFVACIAFAVGTYF